METPLQSDAAKELSQLAKMFAGHNDPKANTINALAGIVGIPVDDPEFLEVLAAIQRRIQEIITIAQTAKDRDFDEDARKIILKAAREFLNALHPRMAGTAWDQNKARHLGESNIYALTLFSTIARRYKPLRLISEAERADAIAKVDAAKQAVADDGDLEDWEKSILTAGLDRVSLMLKHLPFFGHDAALAEMLLAHRRIAALDHGGKQNIAKRSSGFRSTLRALRVAVEIFILPHEGLEALHHYQRMLVEYTNGIICSIEAPAEPPRLITDQTVAIKPDEPTEVPHRAAE